VPIIVKDIQTTYQEILDSLKVIKSNISVDGRQLRAGTVKMYKIESSHSIDNVLMSRFIDLE
jgi:hypothetical protein